ncbi:Hypothetical predicted protein [Mytilus galloprovincialis]|uniref:Uncharacterized protein n=1 Tax=Mytilus galloprovincialis TaxID=29158 RepID=A0A8B6GTM0_MYTGA|nr:Hypothetical predicted protein [Mytilus galloprovincialis]
MRKRNPGEAIAALADDLRQMAQRAYIDLDARAQEVLALNQLYKSVTPEVKYQCTNQGCRTVAGAVEVIERYEAIIGDGSEKKKGSVRMTTDTHLGEASIFSQEPSENQFHDSINGLTRRISQLEDPHQEDIRVQLINFREEPITVHAKEQIGVCESYYEMPEVGNGLAPLPSGPGQHCWDGWKPPRRRREQTNIRSHGKKDGRKHWVILLQVSSPPAPGNGNTVHPDL